MTLRLKIILVSAVLILVVLITSGRVISALDNAANDTDIVNALGRQRMLSQAMAKSALGYTSRRGEYNILKNQTLILSNYITKMRMVYTKHVIPAAKRAGIGISMTPGKETEPSVPFPGTLTRMVNEEFGHIKDFTGREISIDIIAKTPVNPKKGYVLEQDAKAGEYLEQNPGEIYNSTLEEDEKLYLLFYTADVATVKACSSCHSKISRKDFKVGDMLGIRRFKMLLSKDIAAGYEQFNPSLSEYTTAKIIFGKTLSALKAGGEYPADLKMTKSKRVGMIDDKTAQEKIVEIEAKFAEFTKVVDGLINSDEDLNAFALKTAILLESNNLRKLSDDLVNIYTNIANINHKHIYWSAILSSVLVILIAVGMAVYMIIAVIKPIDETTASLKDMAEGEKDLTRKLSDTRTDEIGELSRWFNAFVSGLYNLIEGITEITGHLASSATELYTTAEQSYKGTEKQSAQVGEIATSMEEMRATISEVARNSLAVSDSAKSASNAALTGGNVVSGAIKGMSSIENSVKESAAIIEELGKSSQQIGEIISVIDDIADQTNLLALN
ncbi:MAG: methyl-accepting chemotaxis protein, partial [Nitrospinota bacterium]